MAQAPTRIHVNDGYGAVGIQTPIGAESTQSLNSSGLPIMTKRSPSNE